MKIGFAGPISLRFLCELVRDGDRLPPGYLFAPAADWVKELLRRGHEVTVYTTAQEVQERTSFFGDQLTIRIAPQRSRGTGRDFCGEERKHLEALMALDRCDVIHAHWTYEFALAALTIGTPTLITIHDKPWTVLRYFKDAYRAVRLLMAYEVAFKGKNFTAVSVQTARHFRRYFRPAANIRVIPNAVPDRIFNIRSAREWGQGGFVFATILQGWTAQKNAGVALEAFRQVRHEIPGVRLLMFGLDYQPGGPAEQWAREHDAAEGVTFAGSVSYSDLLNTVANEVDAIVHPSLNEAFSMVSLESLALKKVFIAGQDTPNMSIVLEGGKNGLLVNVREPAAVAQAMISVARNPELCENLAARGYSAVSSQYRLDRITGMYEDAYRLISTA